MIQWTTIPDVLEARMQTLPPTGQTSSDDNETLEATMRYRFIAPDPETETDDIDLTDNFTEQPTAADRDIANRITAITLCGAVVVVLVLSGVQKDRWYLYLPLIAVMVYAAFRRRV
jgi:hypothetical protein